MLLHTPALSASIVAVLAFYAVATPTGLPPHNADELMLRDYNAPSYPSPPSPPHVPKPYSYSNNKVKAEGMSYAPPSPKPPGKTKPEEKPYVTSPLPPLSLPPLTPSKEEKPKPYEKDHSPAPPPKTYPEKPTSEEKPHSPVPPPKSYPEKPKTEGNPYLPLPPTLPYLQPEKKPEGKPYAVPVPKPKTEGNPYLPLPPALPNLKPEMKPDGNPYSREKDEVKQKDRAPKKDDTKSGCVAGKCRRAVAVRCVCPHFPSFISDCTPGESHRENTPASGSSGRSFGRCVTEVRLSSFPSSAGTNDGRSVRSFLTLAPFFDAMSY
jgi:hypothetical protein